MGKYQAVYTEYNHNNNTNTGTTSTINSDISELCDNQVMCFVNKILKSSSGGIFENVVVAQDGVLVSNGGSIRKYKIVGLRSMNVRNTSKLLEEHVPWCELYVEQDWKQINNGRKLITEFFLAVDLNVFHDYQNLFNVKHRDKLFQRDMILAFIFFILSFYCIYFGLFNHWQGYDDPLQDYLTWMFGLHTNVFVNKNIQEVIKDNNNNNDDEFIRNTKEILLQK